VATLTVVAGRTGLRAHRELSENPVRLRTSAARYKKEEHATARMWRLLLVVERDFRMLTAPHRCPEI